MKNKLCVKFEEFFGADVDYDWYYNTDWSKRNDLADWLTQKTAIVGIVGGLGAAIAAEITGIAALGTVGLIAGAVGLYFYVPAMFNFALDKKNKAPISMKILASLLYAAKNTVMWPINKIKEKIKEHYDDYHTTFKGPYYD